MFEPVYHKLSRDLEEYFRREGFSSTRRLPGVLPLSKHFGVSKTTISKALHILQERGVIRIENTCGMFLNKITKKYPVRHKMIGISGLSLSEKIIPYLNQKYRKSGFSLAGLDIPQIKNPKLMHNWLLQMPVDGIILLNSASHPSFLDLFYENNIPVIGSTLPAYTHISGYEPDHYVTYSKILKFLKSKGHRRIAFCAFKPQQEFQFYQDMIRTAFTDTLGDDFDPELFFCKEEIRDNADDDCIDPAPAFSKMLFQHFFNLHEPPTAIIAEQHLLYHIREAAEQRGLKIPNDLSLFSIKYYFQNDPFYTTAIVRDEICAEKAFLKMINILNGKEEKTEHIFIPMSFKKGNSVAECKQNSNQKDTL